VADLPSRLGPAVLVGAHAGVTVSRVTAGFVKHYIDAGRARRERAALSIDLGIVAPRILDSGPDWNLLSDERLGRDPRSGPLVREQLAQASRLLAALHARRVPGSLPARDHARGLKARVAAAGDPVALAFQNLVPIGDAFCHHDLHASNWILQEGQPIGLLDWASSGHADPEEDLAALLHSSLEGLEHLELVAGAWETASGRTADRQRIWAYGLLQAAEDASPVPAPGHFEALHGQRRTARCVAKTEDPTRFWLPLQAPQIDAVLAREGLPGARVTEGFARHACNDVLRVLHGERRLVLKVYNKPVSRWLFALELELAERLAGSAAAVLPPLRLPSGGHLIRIGDRVGALYTDCGDQRLDTSPGDLRRLARAQGALLALGPLGPTHRPKNYDIGLLRRRTGNALDPTTWERLAALLKEVSPNLSGFPQALVHGSLHRDHLGRHPDGRVVLFDLEKAQCGPRVEAIAHTAYHAAYRSNDERLDPQKLVFFLRELHRVSPLTALERDAVVPLILRCFVRDIGAFYVDGAGGVGAESHLRTTWEFSHNRANLAGALERYLPAG
jgi:Ser/Thr protein kinase RdoA (MazF antagonist)